MDHLINSMMITTYQVLYYSKWGTNTNLVLSQPNHSNNINCIFSTYDYFFSLSFTEITNTKNVHCKS